MRLRKQWYSAIELAVLRLENFPRTERGVNRRARREGWRLKKAARNRPLSRRKRGRGGGWVYHVQLFPMHVQEQLAVIEEAAHGNRTKRRQPRRFLRRLSDAVLKRLQRLLPIKPTGREGAQ